MPPPKRAVRHGDRVRHVSHTTKSARASGTATVVDVHAGAKTKAKPAANAKAPPAESTAAASKHLAYTVLPDDRPRSKGAVVWPAAETVHVAGPPARCPLCGSTHSIFDCPKGA